MPWSWEHVLLWKVLNWSLLFRYVQLALHLYKNTYCRWCVHFEAFNLWDLVIWGMPIKQCCFPFFKFDFCGCLQDRLPIFINPNHPACTKNNALVNLLSHAVFSV